MTKAETITYTRELEDGSVITLECSIYYKRKRCRTIINMTLLLEKINV